MQPVHNLGQALPIQSQPVAAYAETKKPYELMCFQRMSKIIN